MSTNNDDDNTDVNMQKIVKKTIRVLALHGSEGTAEAFPSRLDALQTALLADDQNVNLDITAVQAPFSKGNGFAWWNMPPGVRSFTATEYEGFDTSAQIVLEAWGKTKTSSSSSSPSPPFDLVLGHSQGAIMIAALLTLGRVPYHPKMGYVLNGVSFPNPYTEQVESLSIMEEEEAVVDAPPRPRVLFVMGVNDKITPNSTGEQLRDGFKKAGFPVSTIKHQGGHGFPGEQDDTMSDIVDWILQ
jgi:predicted esterase